MFAGWQTAALKAHRKPLLWPWPWGACSGSGLGPGVGACWGKWPWPWGACWTRCLEGRFWRAPGGFGGFWRVLEGGPTGQVPHLRWSQAPPRPWRRPGSADLLIVLVGHLRGHHPRCLLHRLEKSRCKARLCWLLCSMDYPWRSRNGQNGLPVGYKINMNSPL